MKKPSFNQSMIKLNLLEEKPEQQHNQICYSQYSQYFKGYII